MYINIKVSSYEYISYVLKGSISNSFQNLRYGLFSQKVTAYESEIFYAAIMHGQVWRNPRTVSISNRDKRKMQIYTSTR